MKTKELTSRAEQIEESSLSLSLLLLLSYDNLVPLVMILMVLLILTPLQYLGRMNPVLLLLPSLQQLVLPQFFTHNTAKSCRYPSALNGARVHHPPVVSAFHQSTAVKYTMS